MIIGLLLLTFCALKLLSRFALPQIIEQNLLHEATTATALKMSYDFIGALFNPSHLSLISKNENTSRAWMASPCVSSKFCMAKSASMSQSWSPDESSGVAGRKNQVFPCLIFCHWLFTSCQHNVNLFLYVCPLVSILIVNISDFWNNGELSLPSTRASNKSSCVLEGKQAILLRC